MDDRRREPARLPAPELRPLAAARGWRRSSWRRARGGTRGAARPRPALGLFGAAVPRDARALGVGQHQGDAVVLRRRCCRRSRAWLARLRPALRAAAARACSSPRGSRACSGLLRAPAAARGARRAEYAAVCEALAAARDDARRDRCRPSITRWRCAAGRSWRATPDTCGATASSRGVEARLRRLMKGEPGWREQARALGASHVFWGPREARPSRARRARGKRGRAGRSRELGRALPAGLTAQPVRPTSAASRQHQAQRQQHDGAPDERRGSRASRRSRPGEERRDHRLAEQEQARRSAPAASAARGSRGRGRRASARRRAP